MKGGDADAETVRQWINSSWLHGGRTSPTASQALSALAALAAAVADAEQRADDAEKWPIETLDESALRTIQAQAARVTALETAVADAEQRADDAEERANAYARVIATESDRADAAVLAASASPQGASGG